MSEKTSKVPDSDQYARMRTGNIPEEKTEDPGNIEGLQTSTKTGKHSSVEKEAASRPDFGKSPGYKHVDGAFGDPENAVKSNDE